MAEQPIKDKTAIVGIGWTLFTRNAGTTVANLAAEASLMAIEDAGLSVQDIDGVVSYFHKKNDTVHSQQMVHMLGMKRCNFTCLNDGGGSWNAASVLSAAMLVYSGICKHVLVYRARKTYSEGRAARLLRANDVAGSDQFITPFGSHHAAATFGHHATAHMARYGTTTLDFAHLAVTQREHATLNKKAMMRKPITIEDHQNSRWIIYPCRLLDCCQESDGAVALVVTSAERARSLRHAPRGGDTAPARLRRREAHAPRAACSHFCTKSQPYSSSHALIRSVVEAAFSGAPSASLSSVKAACTPCRSDDAVAPEGGERGAERGLQRRLERSGDEVHCPHGTTLMGHYVRM